MRRIHAYVIGLLLLGGEAGAQTTYDIDALDPRAGRRRTDLKATAKGDATPAATLNGIRIPTVNNLLATSPIAKAVSGADVTYSINSAALEAMLEGLGFANSLLVDTGDPWQWTQSPAGTYTLRGTGGTWDLAPGDLLTFSGEVGMAVAAWNSDVDPQPDKPANRISVKLPLITYNVESGGVVVGTAADYAESFMDFYNNLPANDLNAPPARPRVAMISGDGEFVHDPEYAGDPALGGGIGGGTFGSSISLKKPGGKIDVYDGSLRVRGYSALAGPRVWGQIQGAIVGDNLLSERDVHAERNSYTRKVLVSGDGRQAKATKGIQISTEGDGTAPTPGSQISHVYSDINGTHWRKVAGWAGSASSVYSWDDHLHTTGNVETSGTVRAATFSGSGSGLSTASVPDSALSSNVPLKDAPNTFTANQFIDRTVVGSGPASEFLTLWNRDTGASSRVNMVMRGQQATGILSYIAGNLRWFFGWFDGNFQVYAYQGGGIAMICGGTSNFGAAFNKRIAANTTIIPTSGAYVQTPSIDINSTTDSGKATILSGTSSVTVNTTGVEAADAVVLSYNVGSNGGGALWAENITAGTSFVINSTSSVSADTVVNWRLIH